ncbi:MULTISPECIES: sugar diacid recognition domain-containing protein [unclassified Paenibacillus]|uniref:CdaR family transcriptional regulator n=1 Tax=unclassified Paenibacillus TaxID=185978 RepID=UPI00215AF9E5|nr:sugar diacid recognition domain-containing protein [Paenibacillus sp. tmac-D7]
MIRLQLLPELAKKIIHEVESVMTEQLIVVGGQGIIIASTDKNRIGSFHEGATIVMKSGHKLYISDEDAKRLKGVKPGINLPIYYNKKVIGVIGITGTPSVVEPYAELLRRMTELIIREAQQKEKEEWETRGLEAFFYEWIHIQDVDQEFIDRGQILGVSVEIPYICVLFQVDVHHRDEVLREAQSLMTDFFQRSFERDPTDFFIRWGNGQFILIKNAKNNNSPTKLSRELAKWHQYFKKHYGINLAVGVGKTFEPFKMNHTYNEAKKALKVAQKHLEIVYYENLLLDIVLEEISAKTRQEFIDRILSEIQSDQELLETIHIYYKHQLSIKDSADALHIHINTLHYRLNQIKELTGINPKCPEGITLFLIALSLLKLDNHSINQDPN